MRFDKPVRVATGPAGNVAIVVTDAAQAGEFLLSDDWPAAKHRRRQVAARKAVIAAIERAHDRVAAAAAREAFADAADEAGVLMPERAKSEAPPGFRSPSWMIARKPKKKR